MRDFIPLAAELVLELAIDNRCGIMGEALYVRSGPFTAAGGLGGIG